MKKHFRELQSETELPCPFCGTMGAITLDEGGGEHQTYVEDCPTCCKPRIVHIEPAGDEDSMPNVWIERSS